MSPQYKLVIFAPLSHADAVRQAIGDAGGGKLGNYSYCSFSSRGVGRFKPEDGADPHIGSVGKLEEVEEERIETLIDKDEVQKVLDAVKKVHPYDELAFDLIPLETWD